MDSLFVTFYRISLLSSFLPAALEIKLQELKQLQGTYKYAERTFMRLVLPTSEGKKGWSWLWSA